MRSARSKTLNCKNALELECFYLAKNKHNAAPQPVNQNDHFDDDIEAGEVPVPDSPPPTPGSVTQNLYIGLEGDKTVIYEVTPSNDQLRRPAEPNPTK